MGFDLYTSRLALTPTLQPHQSPRSPPPILLPRRADLTRAGPGGGRLDASLSFFLQKAKNTDVFRMPFHTSFPRPFWKFQPKIISRRVTSPGQGTQLPKIQQLLGDQHKTLRSWLRHPYLHKYISDFLFQCPKVTSIFWPDPYLAMRKCSHASYSESTREITLITTTVPVSEENPSESVQCSRS